MLMKLGALGGILSGLAGIAYLKKEGYMNFDILGWFILLFFIGSIAIVICEKYKELKKKYILDLTSIREETKQNVDMIRIGLSADLATMNIETIHKIEELKKMLLGNFDLFNDRIIKLEEWKANEAKTLGFLIERYKAEHSGILPYDEMEFLKAWDEASETDEKK